MPIRDKNIVQNIIEDKYFDVIFTIDYIRSSEGKD